MKKKTWKAIAYAKDVNGTEFVAFKSRTVEGLWKLIDAWKHDQMYFKGQRDPNADENEIDKIIKGLRIEIN